MENQYKEEFRAIFQEHVVRRGGDQLLEWLENTDFFTAPASTKFHCACEYGLVMHSLNVYKVLRKKYFEEGDSEESFALCGLLHDICKAQFYKISTRNVKNDETGQWEKRPFYTVEDAFPYGHGEKSVYLIERFVRLKPAEAMAIRWHMGGFDDSVKGGKLCHQHRVRPLPPGGEASPCRFGGNLSDGARHLRGPALSRERKALWTPSSPTI